MRLEGKIAIVVGAGQKPGETIGNGRATAIRFAQEGATVLCVDYNLDSARETQAMIEAEGGNASSMRADVKNEADCKLFIDACMEQYGRIDILQNNVGLGTGDKGPTSLELETWHNIMDTNLTGMFLTSKHAIPHMRRQKSGVITNISSGAAVMSVGLLGYKVSKAGVNALTHTIAMGNAKYGIRCNAIMPGLLDTPMAIESHSKAREIDRGALRAERNAMVPMGVMGTAWDTANASVFLASDEARFITAVILPVDGGQSARIGL
jgi:NAD(P)-dependent dehydrogenase (short-subunit alcohol dehydrogenase family)